jgi:hypothetical protein
MLILMRHAELVSASTVMKELLNMKDIAHADAVIQRHDSLRGVACHAVEGQHLPVRKLIWNMNALAQADAGIHRHDAQSKDDIQNTSFNVLTTPYSKPYV